MIFFCVWKSGQLRSEMFVWGLGDCKGKRILKKKKSFFFGDGPIAASASGKYEVHRKIHRKYYMHRKILCTEENTVYIEHVVYRG